MLTIHALQRFFTSQYFPFASGRSGQAFRKESERKFNKKSMRSDTWVLEKVLTLQI